MYPVSITLNVPNPTVMAAVLAILNGTTEAPETPAVVKSNRKPKEDAPAPSPKSETAPAAPAAPEKAPEASSDAPSAPEGPSYLDTAKFVTKVSQTKGRDAAVGLLKGFNAATLKDVKKEQFADVIAAAKKLLGEE